jgi:hypothetical protein
MAIANASTGALGLRLEGSFGSGGAVDTFQPIISESIIPRVGYFYPSQIMGTRMQQGGRKMNELVNGSVNFYITPSGSQLWYRCGLGNSTSPYSPKGVDTLESLVLHIDKANANHDLYTSGDMITSLDISSSSSDALQCAVGIEGKGFASGDMAAATFISGDDPYLHHEAVFTVGGVTDNEITAWSVSVNNNNITDLFTGSNIERREIPATNTTVTGTISRLFTDKTAYELFLARVATSFQVVYTRGSSSFTVNLDNINFEAQDAPLASFSSIIAESIPFTAQINDAALDDVIKITVV